MTNEEAVRYRSERHEIRRPHTGLRLDADERRELDEFALREGLVNAKGKPVRSAALRLRNAFAREHMAAGWRPKAEATTE